MLRRIGWMIGLVVIAGVVASGVRLLGADRRQAATRLGDAVVEEPSQGNTHVASPVTQLSAPTSGPHSGGPVCGVRSTEVPPDSQIHTLEHGGIVMQYRRADVDAGDIELLTKIAGARGEGILVAPNDAIGAPVVLTAWTRRMAMQDVVVSQVEDFVTAFAGRGPESVPCPV